MHQDRLKNPWSRFLKAFAAARGPMESRISDAAKRHWPQPYRQTLSRSMWHVAVCLHPQPPLGDGRRTDENKSPHGLGRGRKTLRL